MWWYFSFADPHKPPGQQWLGAAIVEADNFYAAHRRTHELGVNPGGETRAFRMTHSPGPEFTNRLLSMADIEAMSPVDEAERF